MKSYYLTLLISCSALHASGGAASSAEIILVDSDEECMSASSTDTQDNALVADLAQSRNVDDMRMSILNSGLLDRRNDDELLKIIQRGLEERARLVAQSRRASRALAQAKNDRIKAQKAALDAQTVLANKQSAELQLENVNVLENAKLQRIVRILVRAGKKIPREMLDSSTEETLAELKLEAGNQGLTWWDWINSSCAIQ